MHTNQKYCEYCVKNLKLELQSRKKKERSTNIDARQCDIAPEGNNIFPRTLLVNVKEVSDNPMMR